MENKYIIALLSTGLVLFYLTTNRPSAYKPNPFEPEPDPSPWIKKRDPHPDPWRLKAAPEPWKPRSVLPPNIPGALDFAGIDKKHPLSIHQPTQIPGHYELTDSRYRQGIAPAFKFLQYHRPDQIPIPYQPSSTHLPRIGPDSHIQEGVADSLSRIAGDHTTAIPEINWVGQRMDD